MPRTASVTMACMDFWSLADAWFRTIAVRTEAPRERTMSAARRKPFRHRAEVSADVAPSISPLVTSGMPSDKSDISTLSRQIIAIWRRMDPLQRTIDAREWLLNIVFSLFESSILNPLARL